MIIYITGVPGHGKSLRAMWHLNQPAFKDRDIYSNMAGPKDDELPVGHQPIPNKWMEVPNGSVIVIDECQHRWPQRGPSSKTPEEEEALDTHRHRGIDFILMTQRPTGVSHHVRGLVGRHEHIRRKMGLQKATISTKEEAFNPKDNWQLKEADQQIWNYPKKLYGSYKSSVEHTDAYKFKMPAKAKMYLTALVFGVCGAGFFIYRAASLFDGTGETAQKEQKAPQVEQWYEGNNPGLERMLEDNEEYKPNDRVGICYTTSATGQCKCFRNNGTRAHTWSSAQCLNWVVENGGEVKTGLQATSERSGAAAAAVAVRVSDTAHLSQY